MTSHPRHETRDPRSPALPAGFAPLADTLARAAERRVVRPQDRSHAHLARSRANLRFLHSLFPAIIAFNIVVIGARAGTACGDSVKLRRELLAMQSLPRVGMALPDVGKIFDDLSNPQLPPPLGDPESLRTFEFQPWLEDSDREAYSIVNCLFLMDGTLCSCNAVATVEIQLISDLQLGQIEVGMPYDTVTAILCQPSQIPDPYLEPRTIYLLLRAQGGRSRQLVDITFDAACMVENIMVRSRP